MFPAIPLSLPQKLAYGTIDNQLDKKLEIKNNKIEIRSQKTFLLIEINSRKSDFLLIVNSRENFIVINRIQVKPAKCSKDSFGC